jgi:hypothetical protein
VIISEVVERASVIVTTAVMSIDPSSKNIFNKIFIIIVVIIIRKILVVFKKACNNIVVDGVTAQGAFHVHGTHLDQTRFMKKMLALQGNTKTVFLTYTTLLGLILVNHKRLVKNARIALLVFFYESTTISTKFILIGEIPYVQDGPLDILEFLAPRDIASRIMNIILYPYTDRIVNTSLAVNHSIHKDILIRRDARIFKIYVV